MRPFRPAPAGRADDLGYYALAVLVGVLTGLIGTALHVCVDAVLAWPEVLHRHAALPFPRFLLLCGAVSAGLVLLSVWTVRTFAPEAAGSGVQEIEGAMGGLRRVRWLRVLLVKFFGGVLSLGSGLVIGREGPTIHMGASLAQATSRWRGLGVRDTRGLLAAGAAAGLAAAFSAPLASVLFVIEETRRQFPYSLRTYTAVMLASVVSGIVTQALIGQRPLMAIAVPEIPLSMLWAFAGLGVLLGLAGIVFNRALVWSLDRAAAIGRRAGFYLVPAVVGFAVGLLLVLFPEATKGGETLAVTLTESSLPLIALLALALVRFVMTMASYATGVPGGIFAPILALATSVGLVYGGALDLVLPLPEGMAAALAVTAMGGLFAATVRAPLVGIVLIAELTGAYSVLVPAIITCLVANVVADRFGGRPIYEVLLERTLRLAGTPIPAETRSSDETRPIGGWDQR